MVEKIKALCKEKGTSMYKLEKELNLGNGTIGKWGKNGRVPNYANLSAVASALGVTVAELTGEADEKGIKKGPIPEDEADNMMNPDYLKLNAANRAAIDAAIAAFLASQQSED